MNNDKKPNFKFIVKPTNNISNGYCFGCVGGGGKGQCNGDCTLCQTQR